MLLKTSLLKAQRAREEVTKVWDDALIDLAGIQERSFYACTAGVARLLAELDRPTRSLLASLSSLSSVSSSMDEEGEGEGLGMLQEEPEPEYAVPQPFNVLQYLNIESVLLLASTASIVASSDVQLGKVVGQLLVTALITLP